MLDYGISTIGVTSSLIVGALAQTSPTASWENYGALGILAMTMYIVLTRQAALLEKLTDKIERLTDALEDAAEKKED